VDLADLHDLNRWAEATDAQVMAYTVEGHVDDYLRYANVVLGDVPLRLTCLHVRERK
jgi:hypothetical protein